MILVQIATALAIGAYVVLSKDAQHKRLDATPTQGKHHAGSAALTRLFSVGAALPILGYISRLAMTYSSTYHDAAGALNSSSAGPLAPPWARPAPAAQRRDSGPP